MGFIVIWPTGHQLALNLDRAEALLDSARRAWPGATVRIETAEDYSAGAVAPVPPVRERRTRRASGEGRVRASRPRRRRAE